MNKWKNILDIPCLELKCAYQSLKEPDFQLEAWTSLIKYFDKICDRKYAEEWIFNYIFKFEVEQKEYYKFCLASVNAARVTLSRTISSLEKTEEIKITKPFLKDLVCDIIPFLSEIDKSQELNFSLVNPNNSDAYFYFNILTKLLYGKEYNVTDDALFGVGVLIIRHCIELRIKRALGIDYVETQN